MPSGGPTAVAPAPNDQVWFTEEDAGRVARIDSTGSLIEWSLPHLTSQPGAYADADGQGGVWFPERGSGAISHLDMSGQYRTCLLPFSGEPISVALAPGGRIWFADFGGSRLGRFDSTGNILYWSTVGHLQQPGGVQVMKDGTVWVTDYATNTLARVTSGDRLSFTHLPAPGGALGMCLAQDGTLWIAQQGADRIARIMPGGATSDIKLTSAGTHQPQSITQAADGSLWFTESRANRLGHIPAGSLSVSETAEVGRWPDGITTSGQRIWFTEYFGEAIGFVTNP